MMTAANEKKIAVVTGGSRGIGKAIVLHLSNLGYEVHFTYLKDEKSAQALVEETRSKSQTAVASKVDARDVAASVTLIEKIITENGKIDILVNNAGIISDRLLAMMSTDDWNSVIGTSLNGLFGMTQPTAKQMMKQRSGRIINLTSVSGVIGIPGQTAYCAAKSAIIGFTRSLSKEVAAFGVTVNAVAPGFIDTDMLSALSEKQRAASVAKVPMRRFAK
jgi:3-oxoacyl-[acyl-carrier protein] reductase